MLITGGGSGIGRELAIGMAKQNAQLVLWDIRGTLLTNLGTHTYTHTYIHTYIHTFIRSYIHVDIAKELRSLVPAVKLITSVIDVSNAELVTEAAEALQKKLRTPDIIINNAAVVMGKLFHKLDKHVCICICICMYVYTNGCMYARYAAN